MAHKKPHYLLLQLSTIEILVHNPHFSMPIKQSWQGFQKNNPLYLPWDSALSLFRDVSQTYTGQIWLSIWSCVEKGGVNGLFFILRSVHSCTQCLHVCTSDFALFFSSIQFSLLIFSCIFIEKNLRHFTLFHSATF